MRKAKVKDTYCIINVMPKDTGGYIGSDGVTYKESQLDFLPKSPESETIEGWVARDRDESLYLYHDKPRRNADDWQGIIPHMKMLDESSFPSITWESEPLKVKLIITPIEDE